MVFSQKWIRSALSLGLAVVFISFASSINAAQKKVEPALKTGQIVDGLEKFTPQQRKKIFKGFKESMKQASTSDAINAAAQYLIPQFAQEVRDAEPVSDGGPEPEQQNDDGKALPAWAEEYTTSVDQAVDNMGAQMRNAVLKSILDDLWVAAAQRKPARRTQRESATSRSLEEGMASSNTNLQAQGNRDIYQTYLSWMQEFAQWDKRVNDRKNREIEPWAVAFLERFTGLNGQVRNDTIEALFQAALTGNVIPLGTVDVKNIDPGICNNVGITPLMLAVIRGRYEVINWIREHIPTMINARSLDDMTALHYAALTNDKVIINKLVKSGADIDAIGGPAQQTPLMMAIQCKNSAGSVHLMYLDAALDKVDRSGKTIQEYVKESGDQEIRQYFEEALGLPLVEKENAELTPEGLDLDNLRLYVKDGSKAKMWYDMFSNFTASDRDDTAPVDGKLDIEGIDTQAAGQSLQPSSDSNGGAISPTWNEDTKKLFMAALTGKMNFLLDVEPGNIPFNVINQRGLNALMCAVMGGHDRVVAFICRHGLCDLNYQHAGRAAAHCAVQKGYRSILDILKLFEADFELEISDTLRTPLQMAIEYGKLDMVEYLISTCDVNVSKRSREFAQKYGNKGIISYLSGVRSSSLDLLHLFTVACQYGFAPQIQNLLLKTRNAVLIVNTPVLLRSIDTNESCRMYPLMVAIIYNNVEMARILFLHEARADRRTTEQFLPFMYALDLDKQKENIVKGQTRAELIALLIANYRHQSKADDRPADWSSMEIKDWIEIIPMAVTADSVVVKELLALDREQVLLYRDYLQNTALHLACMQANKDVVALLLQAWGDANISIRNLANKEGKTIATIIKDLLDETPAAKSDRRNVLKNIKKLIDAQVQEELSKEKQLRQQKHREEQEASQRKKQAAREKQAQEQKQKEERALKKQQQKAHKENKQAKATQEQERLKQEAEALTRNEQNEKTVQAAQAAKESKERQERERAEEQRKIQKKAAQSQKKHEKKQRKKEEKSAQAAKRYQMMKEVVTDLIGSAVAQGQHNIEQAAKQQMAKNMLADVIAQAVDKSEQNRVAQERREIARMVTILKAYRDEFIEAGLPDCMDENGLINLEQMNVNMDRYAAYLERVKQWDDTRAQFREQNREIDTQREKSPVDDLIKCYEQGEPWKGLNMVRWGQVDPAAKNAQGISVYDVIEQRYSRTAAPNEIQALRDARAKQSEIQELQNARADYERNNNIAYLNNWKARLFGAAIQGDISVIASLKKEFRKEAAVNSVGNPALPEDQQLQGLNNWSHNIINALDEQGNTPLYVAVYCRNIAFANELLKEFPIAIVGAYHCNKQGHNVVSLLTYPRAQMSFRDYQEWFTWPMHFIFAPYQNIPGIHELKDRIFPPVSGIWIPKGRHNVFKIYEYCYGSKSIPAEAEQVEKKLQEGSREKRYCDYFLNEERRLTARKALFAKRVMPVADYSTMEAHIQAQNQMTDERKS